MEEMFADCKPRRFSRNDTIPTTDVVHRLVSGHIGLYSDEADGKRLLFIHRPGDILPLVEQSEIFPERSYLYIAMNPVEIRTLDRVEFRKRVQDPVLGRKMIVYQHTILQLQTERINNLQGRISARLLERLIFFAHRLGRFDGDKVYIDVPISHVDFATSIGTSRETVNRIMKRLEADKLIHVRKQRITILSLSKIEEALSKQRAEGLANNNDSDTSLATMLQLSVIAGSAAALLVGLS